MFVKFLILIIMCAISQRNIIMANKTKKIICYHGSWSVNRKSLGKFDIATDMDPLLCTHLVYAFFGIQEDGEIKVRDPYVDLEENGGLGNVQKFNDLKLKNPSLKTILSVGGWNAGSTNFSIVAANPNRRAKFMQSAIEFLRRYNFDGLDIDWEYPNERHTLENNDRANFVIWLKELREGFEPLGFLLTAAVRAVGYSAARSYNITEMVKYLDFINVMSYALNGAWNPVVGINAPLHAGSSDLTEREKQRNFDAIAKYWISNGAPRNKLIMGVPFYGRSFVLENPNNHSVGAPHTGPGIGGPYTKQSGIIGYNELCEKFQQEISLWHLEWESNQMVPYAYREHQWIGYDNEKSVALKVDYVNRENLGGIMIWTVELDDFRGVCGLKPFPLLTIINEGLFVAKPTNLTIEKK